MGNKTISGYTTTLNCVEMDYPFIESIQSLLGFCDEVIVVDGGSEDGTIEALQPLAASDPRLKIHVEPIDYSTPNWALYQDGFQKARARSHCTGDFCWQNDNDEIILESDFKRIRRLPDAMQDHTMIMLPMVEFWGALDRVRGDFFSWKPRFSVNDPRITHGIPRDIKCYDMAGYEYARPFGD